ncbi:MAG TPA: hypothetical protein VGE15_10250, partial [Sphingobacteriaceae bacterium]
VTLMIPQAIDLSVAEGNSIEFDFTADLKSLVSGLEKLNAVILSYRSNVPWFLSISAGTEHFAGGDPSKPMPASLVQFRRNGTGTYSAISTVPASLSGSSSAKNSRGSATISIDYKIVPGFGYPSSNDYSIGITYTVSSI